MDFEIYCDESGLEALTDKTAHNYTAIGGVWLPKEYRSKLKTSIRQIKESHGVSGELKWKKVSPYYYELYRDIIDYFFDAGYLKFRVILIKSEVVDNIIFNNNDPELGFYKFYYQLIHHWILDFNTYDIYIDYKLNRSKNRLKDLKKCLDLANLTSKIDQLQALDSIESTGIQLADILTGLVSSKFNEKVKQHSIKARLISYVEEKYLSSALAPTSRTEQKFNVFEIRLNGGW